jgi:exopolyphosphatase/guanosine-5'-triphosphate,3'-diphosphate pyrophosphatase
MERLPPPGPPLLPAPFPSEECGELEPVKIYLVRNARAVARDEWDGDELLRPLSERGEVEAEAIAEHLSGLGVARVIAAPELRCQQTVEPLAGAAGRSVHVDERLAAGSDVEKALEVLPSFDEGPVVLCSHADVILGLLRFFELGEPDPRDGRPPCRKGSIWVLQGFGRTPTAATYLEPVARSKGGRPRFPEPEGPRRVRAAVLDLGSTSFNLLIADATPRGEIRPVVQEKVMLQLGAVIASQSRIPDEAAESAVAVGRALCDVARREKVEMMLPVATAALRDARNGGEVAERIGSVIGTPVRILSGEEEARVIFRALRARVGLGGGRALALDLGGGSLELAIGSEARGVEWAASLPLGVVRLRGRHVKGDPMTPREAGVIDECVRALLAPHLEEIARLRPGAALAAGGTARALARLLAERERGARVSGPLPLPTGKLAELRDRLVPSSSRERLRMRGVRRGRADLLPTGAVVLASVADALGVEGFTVSDWGLREGALLEALQPAPRRR